MFLRASIDSGIGLTAGKKMCGKAIPQSDDTYLTTVQLRKKFIQLKKLLKIQLILKKEEGKRIENLEAAITQLQKESVANKTVSEVMTKKVIELEEKLKKATNELWNLSVQVQPAIDALTEYKWFMNQKDKKRITDNSGK
jgi:hypothetical protein